MDATVQLQSTMGVSRVSSCRVLEVLEKDFVCVSVLVNEGKKNTP